MLSDSVSKPIFIFSKSAKNLLNRNWGDSYKSPYNKSKYQWVKTKGVGDHVARCIVRCGVWVWLGVLSWSGERQQYTPSSCYSAMF